MEIEKKLIVADNDGAFFTVIHTFGPDQEFFANIFL